MYIYSDIYEKPSRQWQMETFGRPSHVFYKLQNVRKLHSFSWGAGRKSWVNCEVAFSKLVIEHLCICLKLVGKNDSINCHLLSSKKMMD